MKQSVEILMLAVAAFLLAVGSAFAGAEMADDGLFVDDFEDGRLDGWEVEEGRGRGPSRVEIEKENGNSVLEVTRAKVLLKDTELTNFSIEAKVRRDYQNGGSKVGFILRGDYTCDIRMVGKLRFRGRGVTFGGMTRGIETDTYRTLKVVCAGETARFYLDGEFEGEALGIDAKAGRIGLFGGTAAHPVYFDDVKIDTQLDPGRFLAADPKVEGDALVFPPGEDVKIDFSLHNYHEKAQNPRFAVNVRTWDGKDVGRGVEPVELQGGEEKAVTVNLGRLPVGYYKMVLDPMGQVMPLAIQRKGDLREPTKPEIYVGAYWYYFAWQRVSPLWWNTYVHACARKLRANNFNMVVNAIGMPADTISILQKYGISSFSRGAHLDHPNVVGAFIGDEPREKDIPRYVKLYRQKHEKYPEKLFTTCMIGDGGLHGHVYDAWDELKEFNQIRMFRWYGIKKAWEGVLRPRAADLIDVLAQAREPSGPYWVILPSFGGNDENAYYGNAVPGQIRSMMHLSAANKAQGIVFYKLHGKNALLGAASQIPPDGKWAAAGEVAAKIAANAKRLRSLEFQGSYDWIDHYLIEGYSLSDGEDRYIYLINKHPRDSVSASVYRLAPGGTLRDLYADEQHAVEERDLKIPGTKRAVKSGAVRLNFGPGEGKLLRYSAPQGAKLGEVSPPQWRDAVPPAEVKGLIDVEETKHVDEDLLESLTGARGYAFIENDQVEGYRLTDGEDGYFYVLNRHPDKKADFRIFRLEPGGRLVDLYDGGAHEVVLEEVQHLRPEVRPEYGVVRLSLAPGAGKLFRYEVPAGKAATQAPPVDYPDWVEQVPEDDVMFLITREVENTPMPGWVPRHDYEANPWKSLNGDQKLYCGPRDSGRVYKNSLYAQAETNIEFKLPDGYTHFVAAAGLGSKNEKTSVVFRVLVDGAEKFRSDVMKIGVPVQPVVVDIRGADTMTLITEDAGDGIYHDYAWWGAARLIKE